MPGLYIIRAFDEKADEIAMFATTSEARVDDLAAVVDRRDGLYSIIEGTQIDEADQEQAFLAAVREGDD